MPFTYVDVLGTKSMGTGGTRAHGHSDNPGSRVHRPQKIIYFLATAQVKCMTTAKPSTWILQLIFCYKPKVEHHFKVRCSLQDHISEFDVQHSISVSSYASRQELAEFLCGLGPQCHHWYSIILPNSTTGIDERVARAFPPLSKQTAAITKRSSCVSETAFPS